ncbi:MAG TPA: MBL fold metallo-hydrolase [Chloroflexia bacterium]|nr:MBL fold metallo-hydrolase [Chloroflexia bacterium]
MADPHAPGNGAPDSPAPAAGRPPATDLPPNAAPQLPRPQALAIPQRLQVKFWGTRGSIPVSGPEYQRYGGNTSCVSISTDSGHLFILDAGSGIRPLGLALGAAAHAAGVPSTGYLLLSHSHWDHIQGFPFFQPAFARNARFSIIGCCEEAETLQTLLAGQMEHCYFPVPLAGLPAQLSFHAVCNGEHRLDGASIAALVQKHTLPSTAFRLQLGRWKIVYASDNEPLNPPTAGAQLMGFDVIDERLVAFTHGADLLIHDAQYSLEEYPHHIGWGHNVPEVAVDTAIRAGVKRLVLFHHDPNHSDDQLDAMVAGAQERARRLGAAGLEVVGARDGLALDL